VEAGNDNDEDVKRTFNNIRAKYGLERKLNSIAFQPKNSSRALQLADFFAFYSRRHVEETERSGGAIPEENVFFERDAGPYLCDRRGRYRVSRELGTFRHNLLERLVKILRIVRSPTSFAIATKRPWRWALVGFCLVIGSALSVALARGLKLSLLALR
jgi:hypothetical protein